MLVPKRHTQEEEGPLGTRSQVLLKADGSHSHRPHEAKHHPQRVSFPPPSIKLANFFVTADQQLRLGDFGLATFNNEEFRSKRSLCGTPNYISPEVIEKK